MKGICFIPPLHDKTVKKIKTETRRIVVSRSGFFNVVSKDGIVKEIWQCDANGWNGENLIPVKPRYNVGDIVYLKEPYCELPFGGYDYKFDAKQYGIPYKNKLFMPASAARYFIKITNVRAERLQDISNVDCFREGIEVIDTFIDDKCGALNHYGIKGLDISELTPIDAYAALIDKINGKGTWDSNPFVWVYEYELTEAKP